MPKKLPPNTVYKRVYLPREYVLWFEETYGGSSFSWLFSKFLENFHSLHKMIPEDLVRHASVETKSEVESE